MVHDELVAALERDGRVEIRQAPWKDPNGFGSSLLVVFGSVALLVFVAGDSFWFWLAGLAGLLLGGAGMWPQLRRLVLWQPLITATQQGVNLGGLDLAWTDIASVRASLSSYSGDHITVWVTPEARHLLPTRRPWKARLSLLGLLLALGGQEDRSSVTVDGHLHGSKVTEVALWLDTEARRRRGTP